MISRQAAAVTFGALVLGASSVPAPAGAQIEGQTDPRARWEAAVTPRYEYAYRKFCECHREEPPETVVVVSGGAITRVYHVHADSNREVPAREGSLDLYWTIEGLFDLIGSAGANADTVRAQYHETLGYPTRIFIDYDAELVGEELDLRLTRLELFD